jgi:hypothetical protein
MEMTPMTDKINILPFVVPVDEAQRAYLENYQWFRTELFQVVDEAMKGKLSPIDFIDALLSAATYVHIKLLDKPDELQARARSIVADAYREITKIQYEPIGVIE